MSLIVIAFFSGVLTVLAPCVLPILPIILGSSLENSKNKYIPYIIIASLSFSIFVFSLALKTTTLFIDVPSTFWKGFSGGLIITLGIITLFPNLWKNLSTKLGLSDGSNKLLNGSSQRQGVTKYVFMGFALGPVFSSCSPTYALILAVILPVGFTQGLIALLAYILGLAVVLLAISLFGQKLVKNLKWASDPKGIFKKILGIIFIAIGLAIFTGFDKTVESKVLDSGFLNTTNFEQQIIDSLNLDEIEQNNQGEKKKESSQEEQKKLCTDGKCEDSSETLSLLKPENILPKQEQTVVSATGYEAPDFVGLQNWINSQPIDSLIDLRGQVVAVKFWTLGCINCINTLDETEALYEKYKEQGFTVIGVHRPEFSYEYNLAEVQKAVTKYGLTFPVVQDNDASTWKAYNNRYWPAWYLIDKQGNIRYTHFGEGKYDQKEQAVVELLAE